MAELLTTDKLSELACVTLYMMYEKMNGKKSRWHHYIKELDRCWLISLYMPRLHFLATSPALPCPALSSLCQGLCLLSCVLYAQGCLLRAVCSGLSAQGCVPRALCLGLFPRGVLQGAVCMRLCLSLSSLPAYCKMTGTKNR